MSPAPSKSERWIVLGAGVGLMITIGAALSWSVYTHPLMAFLGWSSFAVSAVFSAFTLALGVGAIVGGYQHDRVGPRGTVLFGAVLWGLANILAGFGLKTMGFPWMVATWGLLGGLACGMMYVVPGATAAKWFPEERGLANGIILCGFGFGALAFNLIVGAFPVVQHLSDASAHFVVLRDAALAAGQPFSVPHAERHADLATVRAMFLWSGLAYIVIGCLCALVLHQPPPGYFVAKAAGKLALERDFEPGEMLRTRAFYFIWIMLFVNSICGLALFSNGVPIYGRVAGITGAAATIAFGTVSSANGIGRLLWAWLSDFIGRMPSLSLCFVLQGGAVILLWLARGPVSAAIAFGIALLCFGGIYSITPAVMADFFGTKFFGEDYSFIITAAAVGGLIGPLLVAGYEDATGSLTAWLPPVAILVLLTAVVPVFTRRPRAPQPAADAANPVTTA